MQRRTNTRGRLRYPTPEKHCSCGGIMKSRKRRNFPHGRKSDSKTIKFFICSLCKKRTI